MVVKPMHLLQNEVLNKLDSIHNEGMMDGMEYQTWGNISQLLCVKYQLVSLKV